MELLFNLPRLILLNAKMFARQPLPVSLNPVWNNCDIVKRDCKPFNTLGTTEIINSTHSEHIKPKKSIRAYYCDPFTLLEHRASFAVGNSGIFYEHSCVDENVNFLSDLGG